MNRLWKTQRTLVIIFAVASALALFFAGQMISKAVYWADPAHTRVIPEPWMTPGYIGRSWHVNPEEMAAIIGAPASKQKRRTLDEVAEEKGISVEDLIDILREALPKYSRVQ